MEFHGIPWNFIKVPWSSMDLFWGKLKVPWNSMEFHGTREYGKSSMEFHGTLDLDIIPWNSMELGVRQFRWHEQFHGTWSAPISVTRAVPWNSMEFHGTSSAPISMTRAVSWNSMELQVRQFHWHQQLHVIPWNSMDFGVCQFRWHEQFHRIPQCRGTLYMSIVIIVDNSDVEILAVYPCKGRLPLVLVRVCSLFSRTFSRFWFCGSRKTGIWLRFQELLSAWFDYWLDVAMFGARTSCARWFAPYNVLKVVFGRPQRLTVCK